MLSKRITSFPFMTVLGILLAAAILFVLFVFPNPTGLPFTLLRIIIIAVTGYLFFHLYRTGSRSKPSTWEQGKMEDVELEEQNAGELKSAIQVVLDLFAATFPQFSASAYLVNHSETELVRWGHTGERNDFRRSLPLEDTSLRTLLNSPRPEFITPMEQGEILSNLFIDKEKISPSATVLAARIDGKGALNGVLLIEAEQFSDFDENHRSIAASYADLLGVELRHFKSQSSLRADRLFFSYLEAFQNDLDIDWSEDELISSLVRFCETRFPFDKLTLSLVDEHKQDEAVVRRVSGFSKDIGQGDRFSIGETFHGRVIAEGKPLLIDNLGMDEAVQGRFVNGDLKKYPFLSFLGVPLNNRNGVVGVLAVESFASRKYSDSDLTNLQMLGEKAGILLEWWKNYNVVREASMKDGLTGLLNHEAFMERLEEEISRADRYQASLVLMMLDLDKFKRINDTYGHLYGDYVIVETANSLRMSVRNIDLVARYGGEEYAILLINATKEDVFNTCKRIVANVADHTYDKDGISVQMTISAGSSEFPADGTTPRELISIADEAMYEVKKKGGNDVSLVSSEAS